MKSLQTDCAVHFCQLSVLLCPDSSLLFTLRWLDTYTDSERSTGPWLLEDRWTGTHRVSDTGEYSFILQTDPSPASRSLLSTRSLRAFLFYRSSHTAIPRSPAKLPLIRIVTSGEPITPPSGATKAIFSLATAMTHFLPHYKATSLACSRRLARQDPIGSLFTPS